MTSASTTDRSQDGTGASGRTFAVGCDHAAFEPKSAVVAWLEKAGARVIDCGANGPDSVDYPDFADAVCEKVAGEPGAAGILLCGTGIGMSIAANKWPGIRAALVHDVTTARMSRLHNDANVLVIGGGILGPRLIEEIVAAFVETPFEGGRHQRRVDKIHDIEAKRRNR